MNDRLKLLRKKLGLTQEEFAESLDTVFTAISKYELGKIRPGSEFLSKLNRLFHVNINWLLTGEGEIFMSLDDIKYSSSDISATVKLLAEMPEEHRKDCLHFIQDKKLLLDLQKRVEKLENKCQISAK